jgi:hypothetical protein
MRILEIFQDEKQRYSSNRFVGILAAITLCATLVVSAASKRQIDPSDSIVTAVSWICAASLGLGTVNKVAEKVYNKTVTDDNK